MTADNPTSTLSLDLARLNSPPAHVVREFDVVASMDRLEFALRTLAIAQHGANHAREALIAPIANDQGTDAVGVHTTWAAAASLVDKAIADLDRDGRDHIAALKAMFVL